LETLSEHQFKVNYNLIYVTFRQCAHALRCAFICHAQLSR